MADVKLPPFNSGNIESNIQLDPATNSLQVYNAGAFQPLAIGAAAGTQSKGLAGTTSPLVVETVPLWAATANTAAISTGVMTSTAVYLTKGTLVTIVEHFGGKMWVESSPGSGARFSFTLPSRAAA